MNCKASLCVVAKLYKSKSTFILYSLIERRMTHFSILFHCILFFLICQAFLFLYMKKLRENTNKLFYFTIYNEKNDFLGILRPKNRSFIRYFHTVKFQNCLYNHSPFSLSLAPL